MMTSFSGTPLGPSSSSLSSMREAAETSALIGEEEPSPVEGVEEEKNKAVANAKAVASSSPALRNGKRLVEDERVGDIVSRGMLSCGTLHAHLKFARCCRSVSFFRGDT